jgi:peptidylprolyl isomerase
MRTLRLAASLASLALATSALAQGAPRRPLSPGDISDITHLLMFEDHRTFDDTALTRMLHATHPEVRRRTALAIGRIADPRGRALLVAARGDADTSVAATVVFAAGQMRDTSSVSWFDSLLTAPTTPPTVATEAAVALGKIRSPDTRDALVRYLTRAPANARTAPTVGEALLSLGRSTTRGDLAPIVRWATSPNTDIRWRATWALFRPRDPAAVRELLRLSQDTSAEVRYWAVRGLTAPQVDSGGVDHEAAAARLRAAARDPDRRVRTEVIRALPSFSDSLSWSVVAQAITSPDSWLSVSGAEGLARMRTYSAGSVPALVAAMAPGRSSALRVTALTSLRALAPDSAVAPATLMARDTAIMCRVAAVQFFATRGTAGTAMLADLRNDPAPQVSTPAGRAYLAATDTAAAAAARGRGRAAGAGGGGGGGRGRGAAIHTWRTEADYRRIVEYWIVPDYNGAARPTAEWVTARGRFELELYAGDAPIATDDFVRTVESGALVGVEFSRVVPDFVNQQRGIVDTVIVRDEVNRHGLTRANLSWASAGLDTGRPGYTLGHTPQPHNEGDFTALGRVSAGMDVVDRIELGDKVLSAKMLSTGRPRTP